MLTPPRRVFLVLLPLQPQHQSMAASFHGSANIRCVSSPSGGLSSRLAYRSSAALFGFHGRSNIYYFIYFDSSSTDLRRGLVSEVSGGKKKSRTPALKSPPTGAVTDPLPSGFPFCFGYAWAFHDWLIHMVESWTPFCIVGVSRGLLISAARNHINLRWIRPQKNKKLCLHHVHIIWEIKKASELIKGFWH